MSNDVTHIWMYVRRVYHMQSQGRRVPNITIHYFAWTCVTVHCAVCTNQIWKCVGVQFTYIQYTGKYNFLLSSSSLCIICIIWYWWRWWLFSFQSLFRREWQETRKFGIWFLQSTDLVEWKESRIFYSISTLSSFSINWQNLGKVF